MDSSSKDNDLDQLKSHSPPTLVNAYTFVGSDDNQVSEKIPATHIVGRITAIALHVLLFLQYIALTSVWRGHLEHGINGSWLLEGSIRRAIATQMQTLFAAAFSALLVFVTQRQALRVHLSLRQTLTSLHDCLTSWTGLGPALLSVRYQTRQSSSARITVLMIAVYLVAIFAYHTAAPALFDLEPYNATQTVTFEVKYHRPSSPLYDLPFDFLRSMSRYPSWSTPGLYKTNTLHDLCGSTPPAGWRKAPIGGYIDVNKTMFSTSCSLLPGRQTAWDNSTAERPTWNITLDDGRTYNLTKTRPGTVRILPVALDDDKRNPISPNVTLMITSLISSSVRGSQELTTVLKPSMVFDDTPDRRTSNASFVSCTLSTQDGFAEVSTDNRYLNDTGPPTQGILPPSYSWNQTWSRLMSWGFSSDSVWSPVHPAFSQSTNVWTPLPILSDTEIVLLRAFGASVLNDDPNNVNATLSYSDGSPKVFAVRDIEETLAGVTAKMYWTAANIPLNPDPSTELLDDPSSPHTQGTLLFSAYRLHINAIPLFVGLAASTLALALCCILVQPPRAALRAPIPRSVEAAGLLQWTHIMSDGRGKYEGVAGVEHPTVDNLRSAGMAVVWDGIRRRY